VVVYGKEDFVAKAKGMHVVYDSVGKSTFMSSLDCLRPRGMMVSFGNSSGPAPEIAPLLLAQKGSLFLTRPTLASYTASAGRAGLARRRRSQMDRRRQTEAAYSQGLSAPADAAQAHRDLEGRGKTTGKLLLIP
jgi:NADPH2:quinone reductase